MIDFLLQLSFMLAGGVLYQIVRAFRLVGDDFTFRKFILDRKNSQRFVLLAVAFAILQYLLVFEGDFILESLKSYGVVIPVAASSVLGFALSWFAFKMKDSYDA